MTECGNVNSTPKPGQPLTHVYRGTMLGERKGQSCRVVWRRGTMALVEFEDGHQVRVPTYVLRRP